MRIRSLEDVDGCPLYQGTGSIYDLDDKRPRKGSGKPKKVKRGPLGFHIPKPAK